MNPVLNDITRFAWSPGIGDASLAGWLTVLGYYAAAMLCRKRSNWVRAIPCIAPPRRGIALWTTCFVALVALGINKMFNLSSAITAAGRSLAHDAGWYDIRRSVLCWCLLCFAILVLVSIAMAIRLARGASLRARITMATMMLLCAFILARASSYHDFETILGMRLLGLKINWIVELSLLLLVAVAASWRSRNCPDHKAEQAPLHER